TFLTFALFTRTLTFVLFVGRLGLALELRLLAELAPRCLELALGIVVGIATGRAAAIRLRARRPAKATSVAMPVGVDATALDLDREILAAAFGAGIRPLARVGNEADAMLAQNFVDRRQAHRTPPRATGAAPGGPSPSSGGPRSQRRPPCRCRLRRARTRGRQRSGLNCNSRRQA